MFADIISRTNLEAAYLAIVGKFARDSQEGRYHGIDNLKLADHDLSAGELLAQIRAELIARMPIAPALSVAIPKKSNPAKTREIFIYTIKERIKAQAIYAVVLPYFEKHFSDRLFSYRPNKPPYRAAALFARRYRRSFREDHVLVLDLHDYSNFIDRARLKAQLVEVIPETETRQLLELFIDNAVYERGTVVRREQGIVQGVPLIALFANLYLSDLDFRVDRQAAFYIRVGDDLAVLDSDREKLEGIAAELQKEICERKLQLNTDKMFLGPAAHPFAFLGYAFANGTIRLGEGYLLRTIREWETILVYKHESPAKKRLILKGLMRRGDLNFNNRFRDLVSSKPQLTDGGQMRDLSEKFFRILTEFWYGRYTPRNRQGLATELADLGIFSLYNFYRQFHHERV